MFGIKHPDQEAADHAIHLLALDAYRLQHPNTLSGGQKQRLAVAVSVVCRKELRFLMSRRAAWIYDSMMQVVTILRMLAAMGKIIFGGHACIDEFLTCCLQSCDSFCMRAGCRRIICLNEASVARLQEFFFASQEREKETGG